MEAIPKRKLYRINFVTNSCSEIDVHFEVNELKMHEPGFCRSSEGLRYCCHENSFNSINDFLNGAITGNQFNKSEQIDFYKDIISNNDGNCGIKVHEFLSKL